MTISVLYFLGGRKKMALPSSYFRVNRESQMSFLSNSFCTKERIYNGPKEYHFYHHLNGTGSDLPWKDAWKH